MPKGKSKRGGRMRRFGQRVRRLYRRGSSEPKYRIVPLTLGIRAATEPLTYADATHGNESPLDWATEAIQTGNLTELKDAFVYALENVGPSLPAMAVDGAGAGIASWGGRKLRLTKATRLNKDVSVF